MQDWTWFMIVNTIVLSPWEGPRSRVVVSSGTMVLIRCLTGASTEKTVSNALAKEHRRLQAHRARSFCMDFFGSGAITSYGFSIAKAWWSRPVKNWRCNVCAAVNSWLALAWSFWAFLSALDTKEASLARFVRSFRCKILWGSPASGSLSSAP